MWGRKRSRPEHMNVRQYLVVQTEQSRMVSVCTLLKGHPGVAILDQLDDSTALVEMSHETCLQLTRQFPDLAVEPNLRYNVSH